MEFIAIYESGSEAKTDEVVKPWKLKSYPAEFKLKVVKCAKENFNHTATKKFGVDHNRERDINHASIVIFHPRNLNEDDLPPRNPDQLNVLRKLKKKKKLVVQFVSNCKTPSHREDYIAELKKHLDLSEYGKCSNHFCKGKNCYEEVIDDHLFYLAFENSLCKHYVSEKFWNVKRLTVPIVLSKKPLIGLDFPNNSYIAADDFKGPKELADHLLYLQKNFDQYLKYFEWTKVYKKSGAVNPFCKLCQFAVEKKRKTIPNIVDWWKKKPNVL
uniref:Fucosyltransferase n=1 Tax=Ditylenchus dipsaci TaxID=166011 RepID=A0A915DND0_9BILA